MYLKYEQITKQQRFLDSVTAIYIPCGVFYRARKQIFLQFHIPEAWQRHPIRESLGVKVIIGSTPHPLQPGRLGGILTAGIHQAMVSILSTEPLAAQNKVLSRDKR